MNKSICCVNDLAGVGKIALSVMIPILSKKGYSVSTLPTALVSNTLDYGKFEILDTSDYMKKTIGIWHDLDFQFDCITTGFMANPKQVETVKELIMNQNDPLVLVDPIMGDEGKLYPGVEESIVQIMRQLAGLADILVPNFTEACFLCEFSFEKNTLTLKEAEKLVRKCRELGCKSVVITSANVQNHPCVIGYDHKKDDFFMINFEWIDVRFPGTGDIFSAILVSDVLNDKNLHDATLHAMNVVTALIKENFENLDKYRGVEIERFISEGKL